MRARGEFQMAQPAPERAGVHGGDLRLLPMAILITLGVVALPAAAGWILLAAGYATSAMVSIALAVVLSLLLTLAGTAAWSGRARQEDMLFSELLIWGWFRCWRCERQLADARRVLADLSRTETPTRSPDRAEVLQGVANALEAQDVYLHGHSRRVARHAVLVARAMDLPAAEVSRIRTAAAVHDLGKLYVPAEILGKPGALTGEEFELIKRHPVDGAEMVSSLGDSVLTEIVLHHHERVDGKGYPTGLAGQEVPLGARIVAVVDTFDAITSARPYRQARSHRSALETLRESAGTQLDAEAVDAFVRCYAGRRSVIFWAALTSAWRRFLGAPGNAGAAVVPSAVRSASLAATATTACALTAGVSLVIGLGGGVPSVAAADSAARTASAQAAAAAKHHRVLASSSTRTAAGTPWSRAKRGAGNGSGAARHGRTRAGTRGSTSVQPRRGSAAARRAASGSFTQVSLRVKSPARPSSSAHGSSPSGAGSSARSGRGRSSGSPTSSGSSSQSSNGSSSSGSASPTNPTGSGAPGSTEHHHHKHHSPKPDPPGHSGTAPGQTGETPGQSGSPPPGQSGHHGHHH